MPAETLHSGPLVVFVGAGASAIAPSSLPGWIDFNSTLLECLGEQLATYSRNRQPVDEMLAAIKERRDTASILPPDFQAQLIEEEIGADYFRVWQSLDTDVFGPVHAGVAELAAQGRIAAIITTNFDRLLEVALHARGIAHTVFHDAAAFDRLGADVTADALPILKIHGSLEDANSLVDTLRQRLTGRPQALTAALRTLLTRHHWLFLGFSGADFSYDPHYLGILSAADEACGFTFVAREGAAVQRGVSELAARYGEKATVVTGDLQTWLAETFALPPLPVPDAGDRAPERVAAAVRASISTWVRTLAPLSVVNILCTLLRTIGLEEQTHWLLRRTFKRYRTPDDTRSGIAYDRYNLNYGLSLMTHGFIGNPVACADDLSNVAEYKAAADVDACEFFARASRARTLHVAGAHLATCTAYLGDVRRALHLAARCTDDAITSTNPLDYVDVTVACAPLYEMTHLITEALPALARCADTARRMGDAPRHAHALVWLARFFCFCGEFDRARTALEEAESIADRLSLPDAHLLCRMTRGRLLLDSASDDTQAQALLQSVVDDLHARATSPLFSSIDPTDPSASPVTVTGTPPLLCRALLDLNRASRFTGDGDALNATLAELQRITMTGFGGYLVHLQVARAQCHLHYVGPDSLRIVEQCIADIADLYQEGGNPYAASMVDELTAAVHETRARSTPGAAAD
jgi:hypothetical protein